MTPRHKELRKTRFPFSNGSGFYENMLSHEERMANLQRSAIWGLVARETRLSTPATRRAYRRHTKTASD